MKNSVKTAIAFLMACLFAFAACTGGGSTPAPTPTPAPAATAAATAAPTQQAQAAAPSDDDDVWNMIGWPEHPNVPGLKIPGWEELPALSDEFRFRQTDPSITREMEGNMYKKGWPLVENTETITILARQSSTIIDITKDHWLMDRVREQSNVVIDWRLIPEAGWTEGVRLEIAAGTLPDVIIGGGFSKTDQLTYGEQQGIFLDLKPYFNDYTFYIKSVFNKRPDMLDYITTPQGKVFSLFANACNFHVSMVNKMWVNTGWLDNLGLDKPTTTEEFADMLYKFKNDDPNGNGLADELPLVGSPGGWAARIDGFLVNAFILHPPNVNWIIERNDTATFSFIEPEFKDAMKYINMLYNEGLIDRDSFVRDGSALSGLGLANEDYDIIGAFPGGYYGVAGYDIDHTTDRSKVWEPIAPLKGPGGVQVTWQDPFGSMAEGQFVVTKNAKNPILCVRWIDYFFSPNNDIGPYGSYWEFAKQGDMNLFWDAQAYYVPNDAQFDGRSENTRVESLGFPYAYVSFDQRAIPAAENANGYDTLMYGWTRKYYEPYATSKYFPQQFFVPLDILNDYSQSLTEIRDYYNEMVVRFMTGDTDVESEWDNYLKTIDSLGKELVLEQAQIAYDVYYGR